MRPGPRRGLRSPGVGREVIDSSAASRTVVWADGARRGVAVRPRDAGPAEFGRLREPVEGLGHAGEFDDADAGREEIEERAEQGGLAGMPVLGRDDERDAGLDEEPELGRQSASSVPSRRSAMRERGSVHVADGHGPALARCGPRESPANCGGSGGRPAYGHPSGASNDAGYVPRLGTVPCRLR